MRVTGAQKVPQSLRAVGERSRIPDGLQGGPTGPAAGGPLQLASLGPQDLGVLIPATPSRLPGGFTLPHRSVETLGRGPRSKTRAPMHMDSGALGSLGFRV